ncbi:zinc-binding dehydrogenase [Vibrio profundum]|uniref:zinc-binding dehydrogenase n=1 Tax=Vibrio profundum TaxID=2910247 RepID=UPI003D0CEA61
MKAIVALQPGSPDVLTFVNIEEPHLAPDEVKIRVKAFGLNKAEAYYRAGAFGELNPKLALGIEAAGEVIEDPSKHFQPGDKVITAMGGMMFARHGSYAEIISVHRNNVQKINSDIDYVTLASLPEAYGTIWGALDKTLNIQSGETLLVRGATSSLGMAGLAYAKAKGLKVIATTRRENMLSFLKDKGADHATLDDGNIQGKVLDLFPNGIDSALEVVGVATLIDTMKTLKPWGKVNVVGALGGMPILENFNLLSDLPSSVQLSFFQSDMIGHEQIKLSDSPIDWIADQVQKGIIPSIISQVFEYEDIQKAHALLDSNQAGGKLVVKVG